MAIDMKHQPPEDRREEIARAALSSLLTVAGLGGDVF